MLSGSKQRQRQHGPFYYSEVRPRARARLRLFTHALVWRGWQLVRAAEQDATLPARIEIEKDLHRTFPGADRHAAARNEGSRLTFIPFTQVITSTAPRRASGRCDAC